MATYNNVITNVSGSVGIGTTDASSRLVVLGNSSLPSEPIVTLRPGGAQTGGAGVLNVQNSGGTSLFFVTGSGSVGIGTTNPEGNLDIRVNGIGGTVQSAWSNAGMPYDTYGNLTITQRHSTAVGSGAAAGFGYAGPLIDFRAANVAAEWSVSQIMGVVDPFGTGTYNGGLAFLVSGGGSTDPAGRRNAGDAPQVRMLVGAAKTYISTNVGIGTTDPTNLLTVNQASNTSGGTTTSYGFMLNNQGSARLSIGNDGTNTLIQSWSSNPLVINAQGNNISLGGSAAGPNTAVGVGTPNARLHVQGSTTTTTPTLLVRENQAMANATAAFDVQNSSSTSLFFVSGSGNVGIGISTPGVRLDVFAGGNTAARFVSNLANTSPVLNAEPGIILYTQNSTAGNYMSITNRDASYNANAQMNFINVNHTGDSAINFVTRTGATIGERLRITAAGNVGIGVTSPPSLLSIDSASSHTTNDLVFTFDSAGNYRNGISNNMNSGDLDGNKMMFNVCNTSTTVSNLIMTLTGRGRVGIGDTAPAYKLVVSNGDTSQTGAMFINAAVNSTGKGLVISSNTRTSADNAVLALEVINRTNGNTLAATVAGDVGIGITNPSSRLHVAGGDIRFDSTYGIIGATNTAGNVLRADGTRFVPAQLSYSDLSTTNMPVRTVSYTSITGVSGDWYPLFKFGATDTTGAVVCTLSTASHSSVTFAVNRGWPGNNFYSISVLNCVLNPNGGFPVVTEIRVIADSAGTYDAQVEVKLVWSSGPTTNVTASVMASPMNVVFAASLATTAAGSASPGVSDSVVLSNNMMRAKGNIITPAGVGIGTTNPSVKLHVNGSGTEQFRIMGDGAGFLFSGYDQTNSRGRIGAYTGAAYTSLILNEGGGNVGVGTQIPNARLHVNGSGSEQFWIAGGGAGYLFGGYDQTNSRGRIGAYTGAAYTTLILNEGGGNVGIGLTNPDTNVSILRSSGGQFPSSGTTPTNAALRIKASANNAVYVGIDVGSPYGAWIQAADVTGFGATYPVLLNPNGGSVGIGTYNPSGVLEVRQTNNAGRTNVTFINPATASTSNRMRLRIAASGGFNGTDLHPYMEAYEENAGNAANGLAFGTYNGSALGERLRIDASGNVGIGKTNPAYTLDVTGDINYTSALKLGGVNVLFNTSTDVYANIRVLQNNSTSSQDGMYINYNSTGTSAANLRFYANGTNLRMQIDAATGHTLPGTDNAYDLGTSGVRWRTLYLSNTLSAATVTASGLTQGSIVFAGSGGTLSQDNTKLFWDNSNKRLGIGNSAPGYPLDVTGTSRYTGIAYYDGGESINLYGIRGRFSGEAMHLYNKVAIGYPSGWGGDISTTPIYGLSTYGGAILAYNQGTVGIGTATSSVRLYVHGSSTATTPTMLVKEGVASPTNGVLAFEVEKSTGATIFAVSGSGFVGVGTSNPAGTFEVVGVSGSLLLVTDNLSGSLFSVNDVTGLPILEVFSDDTVVAGRVNTNALVVTGSIVGIGTRTPSNTLDVNGTVRVRSVSNATGNFATYSGTGVLQQRTAAEVKTDLSLNNVQNLSVSQIFNNTGAVHGTRSDFANITDFGYQYVQGTTNGPNLNSATQYYAWTIGLGSEYSYANYGAQFAIPRAVANPYMGVRYREATTWSSWHKLAAGNADILTTARTLWGQSFDGSGNVTGNLTSVGNITGNSGITLTAAGTLSLVASGANVITATTNGTEALRIDSSQNVGIGTATAGTRLHVYSGATDEVTRFESTGNPYISLYDTGVRQGYLYSNTSSVELVAENSKPLYLQGATEIRLRTNTSTDRVIINSAGQVGIGTASPNAVLDVSKSSGAVDIRLSNGGTAYMNLYAGSGVGAVTLLAVQSEALVLGTSNSEKMRIDSSGNVGIGITNPASKFVVQSNTQYDGIFLRNSSYSAVARFIGSTVSNDGGILALSYAGSDTAIINGNGDSYLNAGKFGIGTNSPQELLDVYSAGTVTGYNDFVQFRQDNGSGNWSRFLFGQNATNNMLIDVTNQTNTKGNLLLLPFGGYVGIGSATPSATLNVLTADIRGVTIQTGTNSSGDLDAREVMQFRTTASTTGLSFGAGDARLLTLTATSGNQVVWRANRMGLTGSEHVTLQTAGTEAVRIDSSQRVGIGTATMTRKLVVHGSDALINDITIGRGGLSPSATSVTNTVLGNSTFGQATSSQTGNVAIGYLALNNATTGADGNVAMGALALNANTTAKGNVGIGYYALSTITTASGSSAVGYEALKSATGADNTAIGWLSAQGLTTGAGSVAIGTRSLRRGTGGLANTATGTTAVGAYALENGNASSGTTAVGWLAGGLGDMTGWYNTLVGGAAGAALTTAAGVTALGYGAMYFTTTGGDNTAIGNASLYKTTTGAYNVGLGNYSLYNNQVSYLNTAIGYRSLYTQTSGFSIVVGAATLSYGLNTAVGYETLVSSSSGYSNTAVGHSAGSKVTTGISNTLLGYTAGSEITTGNYNVVVGGYTAASFATSSNNIFLSDGAGNLRMIVDSSGRVGIGTTNPSEDLEAFGTDAGIIAHYSGQSRGGIWAFSGARVAFATTTSGDDLVFGYTGSPGTSAGFVERMRIANSTGRVGIGTSPSGLLHTGTGEVWFYNSPGTDHTHFSYGTTGDNYLTHGNDGTFNGATYIRGKSPGGGSVTVATFTLAAGVPRVGIGAAAATYYFRLGADSAAKPTTNTWTIASDRRLKENIQTIRNPLERFLRLRGVEFDWKEKLTAVEPKKRHSGGFIAQELEEAGFDHWVNDVEPDEDEKNYIPQGTKKDFSMGPDFYALTVESIRALKTENDSLKSEIQSLKDQISSILALLNNK